MDSTSSTMNSQLLPNLYSLPTVAAVFLAKFDIKEGYKLVWSKSNNIDLTGLEYKSFPSGIHEYDSNTVLISQKSDNKTYYGFCRFKQINNNGMDEMDRNKIKMYSMGILIEPQEGDKSKKYWKPNDFLLVGWEHINTVDDFLKEYLLVKGIGNSNDEDLAKLEQFYSNLTNSNLSLYSTKSKSLNLENHLLYQLPKLFNILGPLIFPAYKLCLLRKNIVLFNNINQLNKSVDFFANGSFTYLLSLLSIIPQDVNTVTNQEKNNYYGQPLYQIGLNDVGSINKDVHFIASTNDEILKYQTDLYDYGISIEINNTSLFSSDNQTLRSTLKDYQKFKKIYSRIKNLPISNSNLFDDTMSITTSNSIFSNIKFGYPFISDAEDSRGEPEWWLNNATSPVSWREYIWSAFSWFASAGSTSNPTTANESSCRHNEDELNQSEDIIAKKNLIALINVVGYFHKLTKKWFYLINEIILEELEERKPSVHAPRSDVIDNENELNESLISSLTSDTKINIELTYQDITDMELDPYSEQDLDFVKQFVLTYWGGIVNEVDIGIGFQGICC